jgi:asparagine synthase (glutamine-hydrolysing)
MCGIGGKLFFDRGRVVDPALLDRMNVVLAHRGPDDSGVYHAGPIGLAHRRLAIIDLSPGGHQPMANADGSVWIVFNGEIYNFLELRQTLEADGVTFRSRSDTEVMLALYDRKGPGFVNDLRGMFAFALWDTRRRRLLLVRDRLGKKPLYYYLDGEKIVFASEPKGILADPDVPVDADPVAIHHYLTFGYVPSPQSAFRGMAKLAPAHLLIVEDGHARTERYWELRYGPKLDLTEEEAAEQLLANLRESVRLRMISDVPLGAFLSGGIDSSMVVALMAQASSRPVKTFSIGFEDDAYNELPYARAVAERYQTDHHEFTVKPNAIEVFPDLVWHYNEPYADSSAIPTYYLAKMTRQHVTVALNGDAGDENFAGYGRYAGHALSSHYDAVPRPLRRAVGALARALPESGHPRGLYRRGRRFLAAGGEEASRRYLRWIALFPEDLKRRIYTTEFSASMAGRDSFDLALASYDTRARSLVDAVLALDVATYLPDDLLVKVDIATMAHALEARAPMVDHVFMEFAASLPSHMKLRRLTKKYILKRAARPLLPAAVIDRPKMGFGVPIDRWLRHELRDMTHDVLLSRRAIERGIFRESAVRRVLEEHQSGRWQWHLQIWSLLFLEMWFRRFIDAREGIA